jgi:hypothetical protein
MFSHVAWVRNLGAYQHGFLRRHILYELVTKVPGHGK